MPEEAGQPMMGSDSSDGRCSRGLRPDGMGRCAAAEQ
jgi:hypothetical protein